MLRALRVDYTVGAFTLAPATALLSGSVGGAVGVRGQVIAALLVPPLTLLWSGYGDPSDWGYDIGRVFAAAATARWVPAGSPIRSNRIGRLAVVGALLLAVLAVSLWEERSDGLQIKLYYGAVLVLAAVITLYHAYKLVPEPARIPGYVAGLLAYYPCGMAGAWLVFRLLPGTDPQSIALEPASLLFHGYLTHLPGDLLALVLAAFLSSQQRPLGAAPR